MFDASNYWITVVELPEFERSASGLLTPEEVEGLITYVAGQPDDGDVIPDTGGLRALKWPAHGRNSPRVIYFFRDLNMPVYLVAVLGKGESTRFSKSDKAQMRVLVEELVREQWDAQVSPLVAAALRPTA